LMISRPALSATALLVILAGFLIAVVLGFLLRRFVPAPPSTTPSSRSTGKEKVSPKHANSTSESVEGVSEPDEASVAVEVVDSEGLPVASASVHDVRNYSTALAVTDGDGRCSIPHAALQFERRIDVATIRVEHSNHASAVVRFARHATRLRVVLSGMGTLTVRVVDANRAPIPRAVVELDEPERLIEAVGAVWARERRTDENGALIINSLRPGPYVVRAWALGFTEGRTIAFARTKATTEATVVLQPGRTLEVRVSTPEGKAVSGSQVTLQNNSGFTGWSPNTGRVRNFWVRTTGGDGVATFECLPAEIAGGNLTIEGPAHPPKLEAFRLEESTRRIDVTVENGATLLVDVLDASGVPVECRISVYAWHPNGESQELVVEKSGGPAARFTGVMTGRPVDLTVRRHEALVHKETLELSPSQERTLTVRLPAEGRVELAARDGEGAPVAGRVVLKEVKASRDERVYAVQLGPSGTATASVIQGSYKAEFEPREGVRVERAIVVEGDTRVVFEVPSGKTLEGILVDPQGQPMPGCGVTWAEPEKGWWGTVTAHDGSFRLKRVPGGSGHLSIEIQGFRMTVHKGPLPSDGRFVAPVSTISGRVLLPDGRPTAAIVQIQGAAMNKEATTLLGNVFGAAEDGSFKIRVPAGRWSVWAWAARYEAWDILADVTSPGSTAVVTVQLAAVSPPLEEPPK